jgi:aminotransferase
MISGYSKTFSITGWRIGYSVCKKEWADMIGYVNDLVYVCGPAPLQMGVASGILELPPSYYDGLCEEFKAKRDKICNALKNAGLTPIVPQGAYYVLADATKLPGENSKEKAMYLLEKTGVASVPGMAFYADGGGENLVRFCFAKTDEVLDEACKRIENLKLL